jgi:hypothetical protein
MSDPQNETADHARARSGRNIALALGLAVFVVLVFVVTLIKMSGHGGL